MNLRTSIFDALNLTRSHRLTQATQTIQAAILGRMQHAKEPNAPVHAKYSGKSVRPLGQVVQTLQKLKQSPFPFGKVGRRPISIEPEIAKGAQFLTRSFSCKAGSRSYKLYVPNLQLDTKRPLLIMLHGCKQNPSDFAVGTRMNTLAETHGMLVAYPAQIQSANPSACWNWFDPGHQHSGMGEPAIIAGLTAEIIESHDIDRTKIFVAGLSAGGAMAVVMGETYPEVFSGVGVHSGLPYKSANDVVSAFAAMRGDVPLMKVVPKLRTIVFHGDADRTVAPSNGVNIVGGAAFARAEYISDQYTRRVSRDSHGKPIFEHWTLHGAAHAWSGGDAAGSFTYPDGPDVSAEMIRFFLI
ncbi:MAG: PHB depolymerase family esterase [Aestuariivirga sp.]